MVASPPLSGSVLSALTVPGQEQSPSADQFAESFVSAFNDNKPAELAGLLGKSGIGLAGLTRLCNRATTSGLGRSPDPATRKQMQSFVKDVAQQMQSSGKCTKLEYVTFAAAVREAQSKDIGLNYDAPRLPDPKATPITYPSTLRPLLAPGAEPRMDLKNAQLMASTGRLYIGSKGIRPEDGGTGVVAGLKDAVVGDQNASKLKLTTGQSVKYGVAKFFWCWIAWVPKLFGGHPLDDFERWKARDAINLDLLSGAISTHLKGGTG